MNETIVFRGCRVISITLFAFFTMFFSSCGSTDDQVGFRVMSFNIAAGHGDLNGIVRVIQDQDPDLVALQEVDVYWGDRSDFEDQARYLGEALGMHYFFGEIYSFDSDEAGAPRRQYGLGYLSKYPFVHSRNHYLSRLSTQTREPELKHLPGFTEVAVEIEGKRIHFFNTHLDYRPDPSIRRIQVAEMMTILEKTDAPLILFGDLNARPGSSELNPLFSVLKDVWVNMDDPGYTFPADYPDRRIDYILYSDDFELKNSWVPQTEASDHRPVAADLVLKKFRNR